MNLPLLDDGPEERANELQNIGMHLLLLPLVLSMDTPLTFSSFCPPDAFLFTLLESFPSNRNTLIYTSTPRPSSDNEHLHPKTHHLHPSTFDELRRRDAPVFARGKDKDGHDKPDTSSLFKKYAFFTPGIFMGYTAAFFLIMIAWVGLSTLTSLKVSYGGMFAKSPYALLIWLPSSPTTSLRGYFR